MASSSKLRAGSQLLTKSSWNPGRLTSARRVAARDQLPRGDTWHSWDGAPLCTQETERLGQGRHKTPSHPSGECVDQAPGHLSCSDLGGAQNAGPAESVPLWSTREPKPERLRPGKCRQPRARLRQFPAEQPGA